MRTKTNYLKKFGISNEPWCTEKELYEFLSTFKSSSTFAIKPVDAFSVVEIDTERHPTMVRYLFQTDLGFIDVSRIDSRVYIHHSLICSDL